MRPERSCRGEVMTGPNSTQIMSVTLCSGGPGKLAELAKSPPPVRVGHHNEDKTEKRNL